MSEHTQTDKTPEDKPKNWIKRSIKAVYLAFFLALVGISTLFIAVYNDALGLFGGLPSLEKLEKPDPDLSSVLFSSDGLELGRYYRTNRTPITYSDLSQELIDALLVTEDIRFAKHPGIDLRGFARAFYGFVTGSFQGGGSTITMQLAENLYKTSTANRGTLYQYRICGAVITKVKEYIISILLERNYTKEEIMAMYLNTIPFGSNAFGIKVAADTYFNKEPRELNYKEAAVLVGLINAPTRWNPILNPDNAKRKRTEVLWNLHRNKKLTRVEYDSLDASDFGLNYRVNNQNFGIATYFRTVLRNYLVYWAKNRGYDLFDDGLKIYCSIDSRMQKVAENAMKEHMTELQKRFDKHWDGENPWRDEDGHEIEGFLKGQMRRTKAYKNLKKRLKDQPDSIDHYLHQEKKMRVFTWEGEKDTIMSSYDSLGHYLRFLHAGFMVMDPNTSQIKAWVGGINHEYFKFDHVKQGKRQPGSTFKPFVYGTAIESNFSPCYTAVDEQHTYDLPGQDPPYWSPDNANGKFSGETLTLRRAMAMSVNSVSAKIMHQVKPTNVVNFAKRMGIESKIQPVYSLALGAGGEVSLFEMVGAYCTFVNKGIWTQPLLLHKIEDRNGNVIEEFVPKKRQAINENVAYAMLHMLKGGTEERGGSGFALNRELREGLEIGTKTGTTQNASDGWFMGVTKDFVAGAWVGGEHRSIHFKNWALGQGARTALPIWEKFMNQMYMNPEFGYKKGPFEWSPANFDIELDCSKHVQDEVFDEEEFGDDNQMMQ